LNETRLPLAEIASQAGFGSVRRFNAAFAELYGRPPSAIRRQKPVQVGDA
jgi:AraC family transcriptional regulator of adaptative response / DNA-3-methyladenine glycosylase II